MGLKKGSRVIHVKSGGLDTVTEIEPDYFLSQEIDGTVAPGYKLEIHDGVFRENILTEVPDDPPDLVEGDRVFIISDGKYGTVVGINIDDTDFQILLDPDYQGHQAHLTGNTVSTSRSDLTPLPRGLGRPVGLIWPNRSQKLF